MNKELIFSLNKFADEHETMAKAYRIVANDLMKLQPKVPTTNKKKKKEKSWNKGFKYNGTHWKQVLAAKKGKK